MDSKKNDEIKKMEELGINVLVTNSEGKIVHQTPEKNMEKFCNNCPYLRLLPDPDPYDSFSDNDQKALCLKLEVEIAWALNVWEALKIPIPPNCPLIKNNK